VKKVYFESPRVHFTLSRAQKRKMNNDFALTDAIYGKGKVRVARTLKDANQVTTININGGE
jgi:hypothetical protein